MKFEIEKIVPTNELTKLTDTQNVVLEYLLKKEIEDKEPELNLSPEEIGKTFLEL